MRGNTLVVRGERWRVEEGASVAATVPPFATYLSETPAAYRIVFVHCATGRKRYADWHNPLDMCDIGDLQIMFGGSRKDP